MIQIIQLMVVAKMSAEQAFLMQASGRSAAHRTRLLDESKSSEADLNQALNDGFNTISSHVIEDNTGTYIVYTLYKPDEVDWLAEENEKAHNGRLAAGLS